MRRERVGLFGGTFNPIHAGHIRAVQSVQERFCLNKVLFIPSFIPPHKESPDIASPHDRLRMVELAVAGIPAFLSSSIEINAQEKSYSIITLNKIRKFYPQAWLFFILGLDAFLEIETWRDYENVLEMCHFIVVSRPGFSFEKVRAVLKEKFHHRIHDIAGGEEIVEELFSRFSIFLLPIPALDISASEIRRRLREGEPITGMVPQAVEDYIEKRKLYQS